MRVANRLLAALLAGALAVAGVVVAVEIALAGAGDAHWLLDWRQWRRWALEHTWTTTAMQVTCYALVAAGLILIILALARHKPVALDVQSDRPDVTARVRRSDLEGSLQRAAQSVDGIAKAGARITKKRARVTARSNRRDISGLQDAVTAAVGHRLEPLHLVQPPALQVHVSPRSK
jgi:Family of unknown function (DUF6286)